MSWLSSGRIANPAANAVLVDSGPVIGGFYQFKAYASATVAAIFEIQHQDATNVTTLHSFAFGVGSMGTAPPFEIPEKFMMTLLPNERIRIIQVAAVTGSVSVSIVGNF